MTREIPVPVAVNKRHIHLSKEDAHQLFGETHQFSPHPSPEKLLWPGHTAWIDKVTLAGPKNAIPNVRVLGPLGNQTSIEMSCSDAYRLGLSLQDPEKKRFSPGVTIVGPKGSFSLSSKHMATGRWIYASRTKAGEHGLTEGMKVDVRVGDSWGVTFHQVYVYVPEDDREGWVLYLDTDEANAAAAQTGDTTYILLPED